MRAAVLVSLAVVGLCAVAAACGSGEPAAPGQAPSLEAGAAPGKAVPTWYRDVEPLVQTACAGCHVANGTGGFLLDRETAVLLAAFLAERVASRIMPPWPPGRGGPAIVDARALDDAAIATITAWAAGGTPFGDERDHVERPARTSRLPARTPDLHLAVPLEGAYRRPDNAFVSDEVRCFVLDLPAAAAGGAAIIAAKWQAAHPVGIHSLSGVPLDAEAARRAHARERADGRAGFECGGGLGDLAHGPPLGANGTGAAGDGSSLPDGTAVRVPAGGAVLMRIHYAAAHLGEVADASGVDLWLARETEPVRPLELVTITAPSELPCPTGPSADAADACSRDHAFSRLAGGDAAEVRARADALLAACGTSLEAYTARLPFAASAPDHFAIPSSCASALPFDGVIRVVHPRMLTHGAGIRVEAERADGSYGVLVDIPSWRWAWDGAYVLEQGVAVQAGRKVRVSCTFDNGAAAQWSALTGEPGHDSAARPPFLAPGYVIGAPSRAAETCTAFLGVERTSS